MTGVMRPAQPRKGNLNRAQRLAGVLLRFRDGRTLPRRDGGSSRFALGTPRANQLRASVR